MWIEVPDFSKQRLSLSVKQCTRIILIKNFGNVSFDAEDQSKLFFLKIGSSIFYVCTDVMKVGFVGKKKKGTLFLHPIFFLIATATVFDF